MELKIEISLPIIIAALLVIPSMIAIEGSEDRTRNMIDLAVIDIWHDENMTVSCRIASLGGPYSGNFNVNLTVNGHPYFSDPQIMMDWTGTMNVTFQQRIYWEGEEVEVMVNIYDPQIPADNNTTNDKRVEQWYRHLPDIRTRSIYRDPKTGETTAWIENNAETTAKAPFNISIHLDGILENNITIKEDLGPYTDIRVPMGWTWDRIVSTIEVRVSSDSSFVIDESDESDNNLTVIWESRPEFDFLSGPVVTGVGSENATISWETTIHCIVTVSYSMDSSLAQTSITSGSNLEITDLLPSTQYLAQLSARDDFGRTIRSDRVSFTTDDPDGSGNPSGLFKSSKMVNVTGMFEIPFTALDDIGIRKVDFKMDGKPIGSTGGLGKKSVKGLKVDLSKKNPGEHTISATIESLTGETEIVSDIIWVGDIINEYPEITFNPSPDAVYSGTETFLASIRDPGGIANVSWEVDGEQIDFDEPRRDHSTYFGAWLTWDTTTIDDGRHILSITARNESGGSKKLSRFVEVENILPEPDPHIIMRRLRAEKSGTLFTSRIEITNAGEADAVNIVLKDRIKGFVPLNGDEGTRAVFGSAIDWEVYLRLPRLEPGETRILSYDCVPVLHSREEWDLADPQPVPGDPDSTYTTIITYDRPDGAMSYMHRVGYFCEGTTDGYTMEGAARNALGQSNYVMLTNPQRLMAFHSLNDGRLADFLAEAALLVSDKNGVFGFISDSGGWSTSPESIHDTIEDWSDLLHPSYIGSGFLAILGEDEIIPAWNYDNVAVVNGQWVDVHGSDQGYSLFGSRVPQLVVGRFLGRNAEELLTPVRASHNEHIGVLDNDNHGDALLLAGTGNMVDIFRNDMDDIDERVSPHMSSVTALDRSRFLTDEIRPAALDFEQGWVSGGMVNDDGYGEFVVLDPDEDTVRILDAETGSSTSFDLELSDDAVVVVGDITSDFWDEILIMDDFDHSTNMKIFSTRFNLYNDNLNEWSPGDGVCLGDYDSDGYDDIIIADAHTDHVHVYDKRGHEIDDIDLGLNVRSGDRIEAGDMDDDGDLDIVIADHDSDKLRVFQNPTWDRIDINVNHLGSGDGFGVGNYIHHSWNTRDEAVVVQPDRGGAFQVAWIQWNDDTSSWEGKLQTTMLLPSGGHSSAFVTEMNADTSWEEIAYYNTAESRLRVLDYSGTSARFRSAADPVARNSDLIVFTDHGNSGSWSGLWGIDHVTAVRFDLGTKCPVLFGMACLTGRYHDNDDNFARAVLRAGAGVYVGSTENCYDPLTSASAEIPEDYSTGTAIGYAFRNYEREVATDYRSFGEDRRAMADLWIQEYNLYGDPAFGTDARPPAPPFRAPHHSMTRSEQNIDISVPEPVFTNFTGGKIVSIPEGGHIYEEGQPLIPFFTYTFPIPSGKVVSSLDAAAIGDFTYYSDLELPVFPGYTIRNGPGNDFYALPSKNTAYDPDQSWMPELDLHYSTVKMPDGAIMVKVILYPFQYQQGSYTGMFCKDWNITYKLEDAEARIVDVSGPDDTVGIDDSTEFSYVLEPIGEGTIVTGYSITNEDGEVVNSSGFHEVMINSTTHFREVISFQGLDAGVYGFTVELRSNAGTPIDSYWIPFTIGFEDIRMADLNVPVKTFFNGTNITVDALAINIGDLDVEGVFSISLRNATGASINEVRETVTIEAGDSYSLESGIDFQGLIEDEYHVIAIFRSNYSSSLESVMLRRSGTGIPDPEPVYLLDMEYTMNATGLVEGDDLTITGSINYSKDGVLAFENIPVGLRTDNANFSVGALTDENGTFILTLKNLSAGSYNAVLFSVAGMVSVEEPIAFTVEPLAIGDDDDDDDIVDDDTADDDAADDDDDDDSSDYTILGLLLAIIAISLVVIIALILVRRSTSSSSFDEE